MMSNSMIISMIILVSYGLGSLTGAYYIVKMFTGEDIRKMGSGNVGATNAGRAIGKKGFLLTLLVDVGKVILALMLTAQLAEGEIYSVLSSIFLMIGHLFPIQLGLHGGKGVVVYLASALFLNPFTIGIFAITMGVSYMILKKYTIAGFLSMATIPITAYVIEGSFTIFIGLLSLFVTVLMVHKR
ncbi:MAG: glycerol-3-phosphate acyltransferase [Bacillota bacterium]|uniref:glycerol-3-phosphate acyltransferase n=1 Tax=Rossellomorea sp. FM04394 TaxID=3243076 RepID=UPI0035A6A458